MRNMPEEEKMEVSHESRVTLDSYNFEFKEDEFMTNYEGHWIQKSRVRLVNGMYHKFDRKVAANKHLKTDDQRKTQRQRLMKKLLRNENRILKLAIVKKKPLSKDEKPKSAVSGEGISKKAKKEVCKDKLSKKLAQKDDSSKETVAKDVLVEEPAPMDHVPEKSLPKGGVTKKPGKYLDINYGSDPDVVKYEGFYIHKRSKDRLDKLKEELTQKGLSAEDLRKTLRIECRKEERLFKKEKKPKVLQPSTPVQPRTYPQRRTNMQPKPFMPPRIHTKRPVINTGITPKLHKTFDD